MNKKKLRTYLTALQLIFLLVRTKGEVFNMFNKVASEETNSGSSNDLTLTEAVQSTCKQSRQENEYVQTDKGRDVQHVQQGGFGGNRLWFQQ